MQGPYRTRVNPPAEFDDFWRRVERRRRALGRLPRVSAVFVLLPTLAFSTLELLSPAPPSAPALVRRSIGLSMREPFGLVVAARGATARTGALPPGVPRPELGAAQLGAVQAAITADASASLSRCYAKAREHEPSLSGALVVAVAVKPGREARAVATGRVELLASLGRCASRALEDVRYPASKELLWIHYPLWFEASPG